MAIDQQISVLFAFFIAKLLDPIIALPLVFVGWRQHNLAYAFKISLVFAILSNALLQMIKYNPSFSNFLFGLMISTSAGLFWFLLSRLISVRLKGKVSSDA